MPAQSVTQARTARVAKAVKAGKMKLADLKPLGFRRAVRSMLSMSKAQLAEFSVFTNK